MHYVVHSLYRSSTRGPEDDSVESKHVAPISHYMFNITTVVFDGPSPPFYEWLASYPGCFTAGGKSPSVHSTGGWIGPISGLNVLEQRKSRAPAGN